MNKFIIIFIGMLFISLPSYASTSKEKAKCFGIITNMYCVLPTKFYKRSQVDSLLVYLYKANRGDKIEIKIDGLGGSMSVLNNIILAAKASKAHVSVSLIGDVYSAHAFLYIAIKNKKHKPETSYLMMFHLPFIKDSDISEDTYIRSLQQKYLKKALSEAIKMVKPVLSDKELGMFKAGFDVYITSSCLKRRAYLNNRNLKCWNKFVKVNHNRNTGSKK